MVLTIKELKLPMSSVCPSLVHRPPPSQLPGKLIMQIFKLHLRERIRIFDKMSFLFLTLWVILLCTKPLSKRATNPDIL